MLDITMHRDSELADNFDKDVDLYVLAVTANSFSELQEVADERFIYSPEQLEGLKNDFDDGRYVCDLGE